MTHSIEDEAVATEAVDMGTLIAENASLRDRLLRALAEAENTRRRADRVAEDARKFAVAEFARELLNAVDNLERTVEAAREQAAAAKDATLIEGVQATLRGLWQTLERFGVRPIEALGQRFDPNLHEAVMEVEDREQPPGTVTRVLQQGYTLHDRLLRPARVVVTKRPVRAQPELEDNDLGSEWGSRSVGQR
ncbi:MAG: molecular chaperone GrpE [Alphaproteobacteria bacterium]|nr:molecular chaperone GrpE [Alphaproteobacteria bacterium]